MMKTILICCSILHLTLAKSSTCEVFRGLDTDDKPFPPCDTCYEWYNEYVQKRIWLPHCGKNMLNRWMQQPKWIKRKQYHECIKEGFSSKSNDCHHIKNKILTNCSGFHHGYKMYENKNKTDSVKVKIIFFSEVG